MGLNNTPNADRVHIGIFGRRNAGKSSVINAVTGQNLAIVSEVLGTTTDPVYKAMEILPLGPVVLIDTPGLDDVGELGELRVQKAFQVLNKTDIALLILDVNSGFSKEEEKLLELVKAKNIPFVAVLNKTDIAKEDKIKEFEKLLKDKYNIENVVSVSAEKKDGIFELKEKIASLNTEKEKSPIISDLVCPGETAVLVVPIDESAPKGRLILPQQQTIRDLLDNNAMAAVTQVTTLAKALESFKEPPKIVVTDSQAFKEVAKIVPENVPLTSFSILFARHKGELSTLVNGVKAMDNLKDGDTVLISEGCTHHRQCNDIGSVKIPNAVRKYTGKNLNFEFTSGGEFPLDLSKYSLIIHCGGCMLNEREMKYRIACANDAGIPMVNYGVLLAQVNGILKRSLEPVEKDI
ncbi:[FeFe] hydrogenase H-cluster maturation GTPase HydF [Anaeromassilibacillus sp. An172]|nr:[FeFe] hydrogenase H-cluster maturation GTPase HydF [Anaeromassilibacillus sp. An172]OUP79213.1 [FeFe] hydrogenase H-cluster maturation GTPase HydF [Anaeromassilibacillus sp. An172]